METSSTPRPSKIRSSNPSNRPQTRITSAPPARARGPCVSGFPARGERNLGNLPGTGRGPSAGWWRGTGSPSPLALEPVEGPHPTPAHGQSPASTSTFNTIPRAPARRGIINGAVPVRRKVAGSARSQATTPPPPARQADAQRRGTSRGRGVSTVAWRSFVQRQTYLGPTAAKARHPAPFGTKGRGPIRFDRRNPAAESNRLHGHMARRTPR